MICLKIKKSINDLFLKRKIEKNILLFGNFFRKSIFIEIDLSFYLRKNNISNKKHEKIFRNPIFVNFQQKVHFFLKIDFRKTQFLQKEG